MCVCVCPPQQLLTTTINVLSAGVEKRWFVLFPDLRLLAVQPQPLSMSIFVRNWRRGECHLSFFFYEGKEYCLGSWENYFHCTILISKKNWNLIFLKINEGSLVLNLLVPNLYLSAFLFAMISNWQNIAQLISIRLETYSVMYFIL